MRKIIATEFVTLDGVMEAPDQWSFQFWREDVGKFKENELLKESGALLLGRVTYDIFAEAWPKLTDKENLRRVKKAGGKGPKANTGEDNAFADRMNSIQKFVVSTTLKEAKWNNSKIIKGDVAKEIARLKQQPGKNIVIHGSADLVNSLTRQGLIDEYRLMVFPIVLGKGKRLFNEGTNATLKLVESRNFESGIVVLTYEPKKG